MNLTDRIKFKTNLVYIQPGNGASFDTLLRRAGYGGRKGRRAVLRINRHARKLNRAVLRINRHARKLNPTS